MSCYGAGSATSYIGNALGATIIDGGTWVKYQNGKLVY